ncbi:MAG TPA: hypothetical protein VFI78_00720 [Salinimicrobium sp.]|nr:hypothetical protein [Salinimicrobium sp.]
MKLKLTEAIFWDSDPARLDVHKHCAHIIERVLNYGTLDDWKRLKELYSEEKILSEAKQIRDLHPKTLSFLSNYFNVPKKEFRCCTKTPSTQIHFHY